MRKLVPLVVFVLTTAAFAGGGRIPGLRKPLVCPALNSSTVSMGYVGPVTGCTASNGVQCNNAEAIAFALTLPATNSACGTETVSWNFGDGTTASGSAATHVFQTAASFTVTATITDSRQTYALSTLVSVVVSTPPNRVRNATFDRDLSFWGFDYTLQGGNGLGDASWSNLDSDGSSSSGSMHLRNTANLRAFQQIQCVALNPGEQYTFGGKAYYDGNTTGGAVFAVAEFASPDCSGGTPAVIALPSVQVAFSGARKWTAAQWTANAQPTTHSGYLFLAAGKNGSGTLYEVYFDDVFVRGAQ